MWSSGYTLFAEEASNMFQWTTNQMTFVVIGTLRAKPFSGVIGLGTGSLR